MSDDQSFPVVLYGRVSQVRDARATSVDDQLCELRRWAAREGWPVHSERRDDAVSASRYASGGERSGWSQVMTDLASGVPRGLLTWEFSRNTRDMRVYAVLEELCRTHRVLLGYGGRLYDVTTSSGAFDVGFAALRAAEESHRTSERTCRAADSRAAAGRPHGSLPYGYRRTFDPASGVVTGRAEHPEQAPIVREIVTRLLDGDAAEDIARDLNTRGVPTAAAGRCQKWCPCRAGDARDDWSGEHATTSGRWIGGNLSKLALRPTYAGLRVHHGEVLDDVTATWPALISREQHDRLRVIYGDPARDRFRSDGRVRYLGSGLFRCGREGCDGVMRQLATRRGSYACRTCHRLQRAQAPVDELVEMVVIERLSRPDALDLLHGPDRAREREQARGDVARLRAEEADMRAQLAAGALSPTDMAAWRSGFAPRLRDAEARAKPPEVPRSLGDLAGRDDVAQRWAKLEIGERRVVVDALMTVTILPVGSARARSFDPESVRIEWKSDTP